MKQVEDELALAEVNNVVFPVQIEVLPNCIFHMSDPIIIGVRVVAGILKVGTPLCVPKKDSIVIGTIQSIEHNHDVVTEAKTGQEVCIKIEAPNITFGRQFTATDKIYSLITRKSIDVLKKYFKTHMTKEDWLLVIKMKKMFQIV